MLSSCDVQGLLDFDPFARIDEEGVGGLIRTALEKARAKQPDTKVRSLQGRNGGLRRRGGLTSALAPRAHARNDRICLFITEDL